MDADLQSLQLWKILAFHKAYANNGTVQKLFYNTMF